MNGSMSYERGAAYWCMSTTRTYSHTNTNRITCTHKSKWTYATWCLYGGRFTAQELYKARCYPCIEHCLDAFIRAVREVAQRPAGVSYGFHIRWEEKAGCRGMVESGSAWGYEEGWWRLGAEVLEKSGRRREGWRKGGRYRRTQFKTKLRTTELKSIISRDWAVDVECVRTYQVEGGRV